MDDILWWMYISSDIVFLLTVAFSFWVAYDITETGKAIDDVETQIMCLLDEALQILIPTPVLNYISQYDVANFEMTETGVEKKIVEAVSYAEDVSRPISEKSQMYEDFGDSDHKRPKPKRSTTMSKSRVLVVTPEADFGQGEFRSNKVVVLARSKSSEPSKGKGSPSKVAVKGPKLSAEMPKTPKTPKTPQTDKKAKSVEPEGKTSKTKANASTEVPRSVKTAKTKEKVEVSKEKARSSKQKEKSGKTPSTGSSSKRSIKTTSTKESDSKKVAKTKPVRAPEEEGKSKETQLP